MPIHKYGRGPFCKFKIPGYFRSAGVYAIATPEKIKYVGRCVNLAARYNSGYGQISPRNCFSGGQETNCRVNSLVLAEANMGQDLALWFHQTESPDVIEVELLGSIAPEWNRQGTGGSCVIEEVL